MKHERYFLKKLCIITYVTREIMPSFCEAALARSLISQWELISLLGVLMHIAAISSLISLD